jgi:cyclomaltodextrinase
MDDRIFGDLNILTYRAARLGESQQGVRHNWEIDPLVPAEGDKPMLAVRVESDRSIERVSCIILEPEALEVPLKLIRTEWDDLNWSYCQIWQGRLPARRNGVLVRYKILAFRYDDEEPIPADDNSTFSYLVGDANPPGWSKDAIIYQIMPDRFHPGSEGTWRPAKSIQEIYGGTIRGIIENIDYIQDLGFNCLWLNPILPDKSHHGYHATDYFSVNPRLGTLKDIRELIQKAHERGMRVLLDFVANHWSSEHPYFQAALVDHESEYFDWFFWQEWPHRYETYFKVKELPKINVENPGVRAYLLEAALFWLREIDFDGLRLDYAHGVSLNFWTWFRKEIKTIKPEVWLFGEVTDSPARQLQFYGRLDGCLDFLLTRALRETFAFERMSLTQLDAFLDAHDRFFPANYSRPSFLDNHDMNRFQHLTGGDSRKLKLAALCQFTLSGPPIVYYGTEVGVSQERPVHSPGSSGLAEARQPMLWGDSQDRDLRDFYRWLIHFRREHPVLSSGQRKTLHVDDHDQTFVYKRMDATEQITIAFNLSDEIRVFEVEGHTFQLDPISGDIYY